jgi:hypothetical protein
MGAWGGGIYDSDFTLDLKGTIKGVLRAPLSDDEALAEIWTAHGKGAGDIEAFDYWLVLADQLERSGLPRRDVFERALAIISSGDDIAMLATLEANAGAISRRRRANAELAARLRRPGPAKKRAMLKKPQPLLLERGEALAWPTDKGDSINPYVPEEKLWKLGGFTQDGWGFGVVAEAGYQFHVLAYYAIRTLKYRRPEKPSSELAVHCRASDTYYGTLSKLHLQRAKVERLGRVPSAMLPPAPEPAWDRRQARDAVLRNLSVTGNFGMDAWNTWWSQTKFPHDAPSGTPLDPDAPDQRPRPEGLLE